MIRPARRGTGPRVAVVAVVLLILIVTGILAYYFAVANQAATSLSSEVSSYQAASASQGQELSSALGSISSMQRQLQTLESASPVTVANTSPVTVTLTTTVTSATSSNLPPSIAVVSDQLVVPAGGGGIWALTIKNTGGRSVTALAAQLALKTAEYMCSSGVAAPILTAGPSPCTTTFPSSGTLPPGQTVSASAGGISDAVVGQTYDVSVTATFSGGGNTTMSIAVTATSS